MHDGMHLQTYPDEDKHKHRDKVVRSRDRVLVGQTEEVHDGGTHAQDALDLVSRGLVCINGPDLRLSRGPGGLLQVHLQTGEGRLSLPKQHQNECLFSVISLKNTSGI